MEEDPTGIHISVLKEEVIEGLNIQSKDVVLDCTVNGGGHSSEIARRFDVKIIGIDADAKALERAKINIPNNPILVESNFRNLDKVLLKLEIKKVDRVIFDLGLSSDQLETSGRGFTFRKDEPLKMTFKASPEEKDVTAETIVNEWSEESLETVIKGFGGELRAKKIAHAIVKRREKNPIKTSGELARLIEESLNFKGGKIHPATKTFQALRIAANDELGAIEEGLTKAWQHLSSGGRIVVISFHSLEDRIVKNYFKELAKEGIAKLVTKKPIVPKREEVLKNKRSRSSKLRIIEKI